MSGPNYTQTQVATAILRTGDWAFTLDAVVDALVTWFAMEGGAGPQWGISGNIASYNPLNSTLPMPGSVDTNPPGQPAIQAYVSWSQGIQATVLTLQENQRGYSGIRDVLGNVGGHGDCPHLRAAVLASAWGTGDPPWTATVCGSVPIPPPPKPPPKVSLEGQWVTGVVVF